MKKYLVIATVVVALVALFSFGASAAADVALDATTTINSDGTMVSLDKISVILDGEITTTGYYTALATTDEGNAIVFAAQETAPITGFSIAPTALVDGKLSVKFGGTDASTANSATAEFVFAFVAYDADNNAVALQAYGAGNTFTPATESTIDSCYVYGAEIMDAEGARANGLTVSANYPADTQFAVRSFRNVCTVPAVAE